MPVERFLGIGGGVSKVKTFLVVLRTFTGISYFKRLASKHYFFYEDLSKSKE